MSDAQLSAWGRLGQDPKAISTTTGKPMTVGTLAVSLGGDESAAPLWLGLVAFGGNAESLLKQTRGDCISVAGRLQRRAWVDKEGKQREDLQMVIDNLVSARTVRPGAKRGAEKKGGERTTAHEFNDDINF